MFDVRVVCRPVQEERSLYQGSWLPLFLLRRAAGGVSRARRPSGAPAGFKVLLSLMIIDAARLLNVLSGRLSICSTLTRVTARRPPPCTPVVMSRPQQQPCDRRNIIRNPVLLFRRKQIIFQSFLKSFVRRD